MASSSSSRFVSGGTNDQPTERDEEWRKAQAELDAKHAAAQAQKLQQQGDGGGKSLYETLQANKAAKQEAFEESIRLANQFQSLNEDEVEFLDSVLEGERRKEESVKRETREQMEAFRKQREEAEKAARDGAGGEGEKGEVRETWSVAGKKRKAAKERGAIAGVKIRRKSSTADGEDTVRDDVNKKEEPSESPQASASQATSTKEPTQPTTKLGLGLAGYSSEEDD